MNKIDVIDVSKWQGDIDWKKVKASGIEAAYLKASQGINSMDPRVKIESAEAAAAGMKIGYYHFASLNDTDEVKDAKLEAQYFISVVRQLPKPTLPIVLDIEENAYYLDPSGKKVAKKEALDENGNLKAGYQKLPVLSKEEVLAWIKAFFMELQALGYIDFALYSYTPFLNANLPINHGLGGIKLWLAAYVEKPSIPKGWVGYWLWQYSSGGSVPGIKGRVDLNKF